MQLSLDVLNAADILSAEFQFFVDYLLIFLVFHHLCSLVYKL